MSNLNDVRVLVTGANGFIGSHLTRRLIEENADIYVFSRNNRKIEEISDKIKSFNVDITKFQDVTEIVDKIQPEKIFHLAAFNDVRRLPSLMDKMVQVNVQGTVNLLNALDGQYDCFVNTGTCEEYGNGAAPFVEEQLPMPVSPYSASKVSTTMICRMYNASMGCPIVNVRPFLTYGPDQDATMLIPQVITSCLSNKKIKMTKGEQTRDFNYVGDIVDAYIKASTTKSAIGEVINIGNGKEHRIIDVVKKIVNMMGNPVKIKVGALPCRPGEVMHFYSDNTKAKRILGWHPKIDLEEGLSRTINWYTENWNCGNK